MGGGSTGRAGRAGDGRSPGLGARRAGSLSGSPLSHGAARRGHGEVVGGWARRASGVKPGGDTGSVALVLGQKDPLGPFQASNQGGHWQCCPRSGPEGPSRTLPGVKTGGTQAVLPSFWVIWARSDPSRRQTRGNTVSVTLVLGDLGPTAPSRRQTRGNTVSVTLVLGDLDRPSTLPAQMSANTASLPPGSGPPSPSPCPLRAAP